MSDLFELIGERTPCRQLTLFAGAWYTYGYLPGTDLKASLAVGTAGRTDWTYEPNRDLLTQVKNTAFGSVVSQYDYVSDALGRRTEIARSGARMTESRSDVYGYNDRNELVSAGRDALVASAPEYEYSYDDIGNRLASLDLGDSRVYQANSLNQYTSISNAASTAEAFIPQYDLDGNQTLVRTTTGDWSVTYNGENRPVSWSCGATNITMKFDRMGRRVEYLETESAEESVISDGITNIVVTVTTNAHHRFVYDGYLCVQRLNAAANNAIDLAFGWDPSEPVATRPLWMQRVSGTYNFFYFHDGNKNVSELVSYQSARGVPAHYEYAPFGAVTAATTNTAFTAFNVAETNPFRFSSEYADDALGLVYYNFRHYNPKEGVWQSRDQDELVFGFNLYGFILNCPIQGTDFLGLFCEDECTKQGEKRAKKALAAVFPASWGDDIEANLKKDTNVSVISDASTLASIIDGGMGGGALGAAVGFGTSKVQGSVPTMGYEATKKFQMYFGGVKIWTKVTLEECDCKPCWLWWRHLAWVEGEESEWKPCARGSINLPGVKNVFQSAKEKDINTCIRVHAQALGVKKPKKGRGNHGATSKTR